jgi:PE-PPE domain
MFTVKKIDLLMSLRFSLFILTAVTLLVSDVELTCLPSSAEPMTQSTQLNLREVEATQGTQSKLSAVPPTQSTQSNLSAVPPTQGTQLNLSAVPAQTAVKKPSKWSKKKKITTAIITGCVIATAIAVPVAVSLYHRREVHNARARASEQRTMAQLILGRQQVIASQQEQAINALLRQGPLLTPAQQALLKADLSQVQQAEAGLRVLSSDVQLHVPLTSIITTDNGIVGTLRGDNLKSFYPTNVYPLEYDGFADFPNYPINVFGDLNALVGIFFVP